MFHVVVCVSVFCTYPEIFTSFQWKMTINQFVYCNNNYLIKYKYKYNHMKSLQGGQNEARLIMGTDPDKIMKNSKIKDCLLKSTTQLIISIHWKETIVLSNIYLTFIINKSNWEKYLKWKINLNINAIVRKEQ